MNGTAQKTGYYVIHRQWEHFWCESCKGKGFIEKRRDKMKFKQRCIACGGTGKTTGCTTTETDLVEALINLGLVKPVEKPAE